MAQAITVEQAKALDHVRIIDSELEIAFPCSHCGDPVWIHFGRAKSQPKYILDVTKKPLAERWWGEGSHCSECSGWWQQQRHADYHELIDTTPDDLEVPPEMVSLIWNVFSTAWEKGYRRGAVPRMRRESEEIAWRRTIGESEIERQVRRLVDGAPEPE